MQGVKSTTGLCSCGEPKKKHPCCQACGILCENSHSYALITYRGKTLCFNCRVLWEDLDIRKGEQTSWTAFLYPDGAPDRTKRRSPK